MSEQAIAIRTAGSSQPPRFAPRAWVAGLALVVVILLLWLAFAAPVSRTLEPPEARSLVLVAADGEPIVRRGAIVDQPVEVDRLPDHVWQAFVAIEDRRFRAHPGIDPLGLVRAAWRNLAALEVREGGSTITQQLAKQIYLGSDRTLGRKLKEMLIALWLEAHLGKDQILERYLSAAYFGDNVYGLRAAARHYFSKDPDALTVGESALLAGLVKAPSALSPTDNLSGARERAGFVVEAMRELDMLADGSVDVSDIALRPDRSRVAGGTYFTDWLLAEREGLEEMPGQTIIRTTLDRRLQRLAEDAVRRAPAGAQVAMVAMRPDGQVVAMVGGRDYSQSVYNRATQARRQPGSTFKLFVYLRAIEEGMKPDDQVLDAPVTIDDWSPTNVDGRYRGMINLREAFAISSNVAAVRLAEQAGRSDVIETARALGIRSELDPTPSLALGTSATSLIEMTAAYAGIAGNRFPVTPSGITEARGNWLDRVNSETRRLEDSEWRMMLDLLWSAANIGTGRAAALRTPTFGKTGTTQDNRDAIFIGFAGNLVTGVWIGRDDNRPLGDVAGGGISAQIWRDFMATALGERPTTREIARPLAGAAEPRPVVRQGDGRSFKGKGRGRGRGKGKKGRGG